MAGLAERQRIVDELSAVCNSLGKLDILDGTYMKDRDCKPCLREIMRFLNTDKEPFVVRAYLGELNIIKSDLIPLMVQYCDYNDGDSDLFITILRLCTNLTSSPLVLFENQDVPTETDQRATYNKLVKCLEGFKEAFANDDQIWHTLNIHLRHNLEDEITFERLIIFIRNILQIHVNSTSNLSLNYGSDYHDMCLYRMDKSGMLDTIIKIASETEKGAEYCFHLTEIIYFMLKDQNPETLAKARCQTPNQAKLNSFVDYETLKKTYSECRARDKREKEMQNKLDKLPRFKGASFVVQNLRTSSNLPLMVQSASVRRENISFNKGKTELRKAKNRKPLSSETSMIASDRNTKVSKVSVSLRNFCKLFVEKVYNNYMQQIKHNLIQKRAQEDDESYYLWAIQFFIRFTLSSHLDISNISETLSTSTLHYIQVLMSSYQDKLKIEKKKFRDISKSLHLAVRAYREILCLIKSIEPESDYAQATDTIQRNIFTETEYSTMVLNLFQQYEEQKHSLHYLEDLILTNHIFIELLEKYSETHAPVNMDEPEEVPTDNPAVKKRKKRKSKKTDFRTAHFMTRYCCPDVINAYMQKLNYFKDNSDSLNLAILKFFERIVHDCKQEIILFQASIFKCLIEIMDYHSSLPGHERFVELGKYLMENFARMANKRRWMFQELLFRKTASDCIEIENAIDPPAMPIILPTDENAETDRPFENVGEELPADTIADLKAELAISSDSDWDDEFENENLPANDIADLKAALASDSDGDGDDEVVRPPSGGDEQPTDTIPTSDKRARSESSGSNWDGISLPSGGGDDLPPDDIADLKAALASDSDDDDEVVRPPRGGDEPPTETIPTSDGRERSESSDSEWDGISLPSGDGHEMPPDDIADLKAALASDSED